MKRFESKLSRAGAWVPPPDCRNDTARRDNGDLIVNTLVRTELQKTLIAAVSATDLDAVDKRLLADAKAGTAPSAELFLTYAIGRAAKAIRIIKLGR
jgi:hypothetical protein